MTMEIVAKLVRKNSLDILVSVLHTREIEAYGCKEATNCFPIKGKEQKQRKQKARRECQKDSWHYVQLGPICKVCGLSFLLPAKYLSCFLYI